MPTLVPVDIDPFAASAPPKGITLVPVDHDPFATAPAAAAETSSWQDPNDTSPAAYGGAGVDGRLRDAPTMKQLGSAINDAVGSVAAGVPFSDRLSAAGAAATGLGGHFGDYSGALAELRADDARRMAADPSSERLGRVVGGIGVGLAAAPASLSAAVPSGTGLLARTAAGAGDGAIFGGLQGASDAPDLQDVGDAASRISHGAAYGAAAGFGVPLAGAGLGGLYNAGRSIAGASDSGLNRYASTLLSMATSPRALDRLDQLGPMAMAADASPSLTGLAQGVAAKGGPSTDALVDAMNARYLGQSGRLLDDRNAALGPAISPLGMQSIVAAKKAALGPKFESALDGMPPLDISHVVEQLRGSKAAEGTPEALAMADALRSMTTPAPKASFGLDPLAETAPTGAPRPMAPVEAYGDKITPVRPGMPRPVTLQNLVKDAGGVQDPRGDLKAMGLDMIPGLVAKPGQGLGPDAMRQVAAEGGYLGANTDQAMANTTINDLFDALGNHPVHSVRDAEAVHQWGAFDQARADADQLGKVGAPAGPRAVPPFQPSPADFAAALREDPRVPISDPRTILSAKQAMDDNVTWTPGGPPISSAVKRGEGVYKQARAGLNDVMEAASPAFADANLGYRTASKVQDAFDRGQTVLRGGADQPWPQDYRQEFGAAPLEQQAALRMGQRAEIERNFGQNRNDMAALARMLGDQNDFNRAHIETGFGQDASQALAAALEREQAFQGTRNAVAQGSRTAPMREASRSIDEVTASDPYIPKSGSFGVLAGHMIEAGIRKGAGVLSRNANEETREQLARMLALDGPEFRAAMAANGARKQIQRDAMVRLLRAAGPAPVPALLDGRNGR